MSDKTLWLPEAQPRWIRFPIWLAWVGGLCQYRVCRWIVGCSFFSLLQVSVRNGATSASLPCPPSESARRNAAPRALLVLGCCCCLYCRPRLQPRRALRAILQPLCRWSAARAALFVARRMRLALRRTRAPRRLFGRRTGAHGAAGLISHSPSPFPTLFQRQFSAGTKKKAVAVLRVRRHYGRAQGLEQVLSAGL